MHTQMRATTGVLCGLVAVLVLGMGPVQAQGFWPWSWGNKPRPAEPAPTPRKSAPAPKTQKRGAPSGGGTYRTLCVRTCDGFFFPINFKVGRSKFKTDSEACLQRCGADARLFVHRNPGQKISSAVDLDGKRYVDMENAFRYRKELVPGCECRAGSLTETPAPQAETAAPQFETTTPQAETAAPQAETTTPQAETTNPQNETVVDKTQ